MDDATEARYRARIKAIIREALTEGVVFTDRSLARIAQEAIEEARAETARTLYGGRA